MEVEEDTLYSHLHKLSGANSEESLNQLVSAIWQSRKTGLHDKSHFQSLLCLPSLSDLDPVLACLRSLIRKSTSVEFFAGDDILKLFPPDLPLHLQQSLLLLLQNHHSQWRRDLSTEQRSLPPRVRVSYNVKSVTGLSFDHAIARFDRNDNVAGSNVSESDVLSENTVYKGGLLCLKSMTWTMENRNSEQPKKVAIITLKLQDANSVSGEAEVKFQLTKDTLEAMLRSLTYINDQLTGTVRSNILDITNQVDLSEPMQKKQKQSDTSS